VAPGFEGANAALNVCPTLRWPKGRTIGDASQAVWISWMLQTADPAWDGVNSVSIPLTVKRPGEARVWYAYPDVWGPSLLRSGSLPSRVARRLPESYRDVRRAVNVTRASEISADHTGSR
jgi:hypothetical protein